MCINQQVINKLHICSNQIHNLRSFFFPFLVNMIDISFSFFVPAKSYRSITALNMHIILCSENYRMITIINNGNVSTTCLSLAYSVFVFNKVDNVFICSAFVRIISELMPCQEEFNCRILRDVYEIASEKCKSHEQNVLFRILVGSELGLCVEKTTCVYHLARKDLTNNNKKS